MLRCSMIDPAALEESGFDSPLGSGTGAAVVFGATGGVMDAALRSAYYLVTGKNPDPDAFTAVRGMQGWKEASFDIPGAGTVRTAVASGLGNTRRLLRGVGVRTGVQYDFVEIMACPGGCAGGGGQPIHDGEECAEAARKCPLAPRPQFGAALLPRKPRCAGAVHGVSGQAAVRALAPPAAHRY